MDKILQELFFSPIRASVDQEIESIIMTDIQDKDLRDNLLYIFHLDGEVKPTLEFSKRLRSYLCFLFAQEALIPLERIVPLSTTLELLHNSTLVIDDIQDNSEVRCGRMSLWKKVGMSSAINTGYFLGLFSLQYYQEKRREYNYYDHTVFITQFISRLLCGQQQDLMAGNMDKTIENYYSIARGKTGSLINMACLLGSMSYSYIAERVQVIAEFADSLAIYYQIIDDLKDISDGISLDSSNIYFFVRNKHQSEELVLHEIERIIDKQMNNVTEALRKLHISGILRTYKVDDFINGLLLG